MYSAGRHGVTDEIDLEKAGLSAGERGRISVDTPVPHVFAVGDVIGFPALAPREVGISRYRELARGALVGDSHGMLKLLVSTEDRTLLDVHVFGSGATDLVHIGQAICAGTVEFLVDTVLNHPALSEAYTVAAPDVTTKIRAPEAFGG